MDEEWIDSKAKKRAHIRSVMLVNTSNRSCQQEMWSVEFSSADKELICEEEDNNSMVVLATVAGERLDHLTNHLRRWQGHNCEVCSFFHGRPPNGVQCYLQTTDNEDEKDGGRNFLHEDQVFNENEGRILSLRLANCEAMSYVVYQSRATLSFLVGGAIFSFSTRGVMLSFSTGSSAK
ncbi:hypothetical protein PVK06_002122 [Gossypium arboreum]|uniref:Uncharacterized protein n=1 Tax=Gossypium arboreum TaxID=29729 RepID=A0ABR0R2S7_GOSAR|nr:hypothetical protein PVK06_002122 [Gossypium arboreum]